MEYTVSEFAKLSGVSPRTLRYYDQIDLLKPARILPSRYRVYEKKQVDFLQQILFFKELDIPLGQIKKIISAVSFDSSVVLRQHRQFLLAKKQRIEGLIENIDKTLLAQKGRLHMSDSEKFEGFKQKTVKENEEKFGREARERYGDKAVDESNAKLLRMSPQNYEQFEELGKRLLESLREAVKTNDAAGPLGKEVAQLHKQWLCFTWESYSKEAHVGLVEMVVSDERFKAYYEENAAPGAALFLKEAVRSYLGER